MLLLDPTNTDKEELYDKAKYEIEKPFIVFLAGPCPRKPEEHDWRDDFIKTLAVEDEECDLLKHLVLLSPTNRKYGKWLEAAKYTGDNVYFNQCSWEHAAMELADYILFWVPRTEQQPGFTTNVEFGYWTAKDPSKMIYGRPDGAEKTAYLDYMYRNNGCMCYKYTINDDYRNRQRIYDNLSGLSDLLYWLNKHKQKEDYVKAEVEECENLTESKE